MQLPHRITGLSSARARRVDAGRQINPQIQGYATLLQNDDIMSDGHGDKALIAPNSFHQILHLYRRERIQRANQSA